MGGLGNQMFEYALYKKFLMLGKKARIDTHLYKNLRMHNGFELEKVFETKIEYADGEDVRRIGDVRSNIFAKARRKLGIIKKTHYMPSPLNVARYTPEIFKLENAYLDGYWQSEKYFNDISDEIKKDLKFVKPLIGKNESIARAMIEENSISIHIRRGDYINLPLHQNICTELYYKAAIEYMNDKLESPFYFIFSDDIGWCKANLIIENAAYIDWNKGSDNFFDMHLMSKCKHNIIANSSFSWWGAWLNENPNKIVIAPDIWFNNTEIYQEDIIPDSWVKISKSTQRG